MTQTATKVTTVAKAPMIKVVIAARSESLTKRRPKALSLEKAILVAKVLIGNFQKLALRYVVYKLIVYGYRVIDLYRTDTL